ncbi:GNAT family N-acetyltransferase [Bacteroides sp. 214]|uniref:GNAT family N-acetyltransferase n=1 Tax=Bacteroides sp. 214 TaxID=2302935 RepID=UPI0013D84819|nr:GNAT family N-acetyltransferase [Bacteroides sp. 214]NDW12441.1 GNAT family N-acetyltransferase [Bacteroides sp. 214]
MKEIIAPVDKELIKAELTDDKRLRMTNKSNNQIYIITYHDSPHTMREVGRLREVAFRAAGGGTGESIDIDEYDTMPNPYKQLIVWNPEAEEILGGYRYIRGTDVEFDEKGHPILATAHMFDFSETFIKNYLPVTIELGRSFVTLEYQSSRAGSKGLFALDNLWDGLGALTVIMPEVKYFFGKVTMYPSYHPKGRDMILYFLQKHFPDRDCLLQPIRPLVLETDAKNLAELFCKDAFKEDYKILNTEIRKLGYNIPPLVNAYMSLSPTMRMFGTAINYGFGDVEETGILIAVDEILEEKRMRHIESFIKEGDCTYKVTSGANKVFYETK